jgi:putative transposase
MPTETARLMPYMGQICKGLGRGDLRQACAHDILLAASCPMDHVNRQFHAPTLNKLWVSDFTYVSTWAGSYMSPS